MHIFKQLPGIPDPANASSEAIAKSVLQMLGREDGLEDAGSAEPETTDAVNELQMFWKDMAFVMQTSKFVRENDINVSVCFQPAYIQLSQEFSNALKQVSSFLSPAGKWQYTILELLEVLQTHLDNVFPAKWGELGVAIFSGILSAETPNVPELTSGIFKDTNHVDECFRLRSRYTLALLDSAGEMLAEDPKTTIKEAQRNNVLDNLALADCWTTKADWVQVWQRILQTSDGDEMTSLASSFHDRQMKMKKAAAAEAAKASGEAAVAAPLEELEAASARAADKPKLRPRPCFQTLVDVRKQWAVLDIPVATVHLFMKKLDAFIFEQTHFVDPDVGLDKIVVDTNAETARLQVKQFPPDLQLHFSGRVTRQPVKEPYLFCK